MYAIRSYYDTHHQFTVLPVDAGIKIFVDRFAVLQVLDNLLSNAVKYSPLGGEIQIAAAIVADQCDISIRDNGIGMSAGQVEHAFDKFSYNFV